MRIIGGYDPNTYFVSDLPEGEQTRDGDVLLIHQRGKGTFAFRSEKVLEVRSDFFQRGVIGLLLNDEEASQLREHEKTEDACSTVAELCIEEASGKYDATLLIGKRGTLFSVGMSVPRHLLHMRWPHNVNNTCQIGYQMGFVWV